MKKTVTIRIFDFPIWFCKFWFYSFGFLSEIMEDSNTVHCKKLLAIFSAGTLVIFFLLIANTTHILGNMYR